MEYSCTLAEKEYMRNAADMLVSSGYIIEVIGNWNGRARQGAKEAVLGSDGKGMGDLSKDLSKRLHTYCTDENEKRPGALQLNIWWKLP